MRYYRFHCLLLLALFGCLSSLLSACTVSSSLSADQSGAGNGSQPGGTQTTIQMPATQTSCPAANTARAAILRPLALGGHQNLVYVYNEVPPNTSTSFGHLRRYDVTTGQKIDIVTSGLRIDSAQLSANGQWVLFLSIPDPRTDPEHSAMLQLVRMDGQGLQTLYCAPALVNGIVADPDSMVGHIQWSTDQQSIVFDQAATTLQLLNISNGKLTTLLSSTQSHHFYTPITWLDTHQLFLSLNLPDAAPSELDLLDIRRGTDQPESNLRKIFTNNDSTSDWDFDTSYDGASRFTSLCTLVPSTRHPGFDAIQGPSQILVQDTYGGPTRTLYRDANFAVTTIRAINNRTLLFLLGNDKFSRGGGIDTSKNGLWKINIDGSGLVRLASDPDAARFNLNVFTQYPWSNVSRDNSLYALSQSQTDTGTQTTTRTLFVGSLNGGSPKTIATITDMQQVQLAVAGWTTL